METEKKQNENGIALITAIMLLVILTIIGLASVNTMLTERDIASGETAYKIGFYMADSGIAYARTLKESEIIHRIPNSFIPVHPGAKFRLKFINAYQDKTGDWRWICESETYNTDGNIDAGIITIQAEIKFPTAQSGAKLGDGTEASYN